MQGESKYTKSKVIGGYALLFLLTVLTAFLLYPQINRLVVNEDSVSGANRKLFIIGNTVSRLYEAEALSNAFIQTDSPKAFKAYMGLMEETARNIDSLRHSTSRPEQRSRLDTILYLLKAKTSNLKDLAYVKKSFEPDEFFNEAIAHISSGRDSLAEEVKIVKRHVTTVDSSYVRTGKKRRWFSRNRPDSVLKVSTRHHIIIDTLDRSFQNTDTVVNILKSARENARRQTRDLNRKIVRKESALIKQSGHISARLKDIIGTYEKEEIGHIYFRQQKREETVGTVIRIFFWVAVVAFLLVLSFTFFIFRDISRSQRYRRELESANAYASDLLKSREKMMMTVSHDIKSPLGSVMGYIELLEQTSLDGRQRYFLKNMHGSSEHILKLVTDLLDLSRLENGKLEPEHITFNPFSLFQEVTGTFMPLAMEKQLELSGDFDAGLDGEFKGDALRIRQILTNILSNAVKYTERGHVRFNASWISEEQRIRLEVEDSGSGMTEEEQHRIFDEFTRLKTHSDIEGTGLGLTITLKLIKLLRGEITLKSEPGKGSCFTVLLPVERTGKLVPSPEEGPATDPAETDFSALNVMVVDDDPLQLEMTGALLRNYGAAVRTSSDAGEVISLLQDSHYDLVFTDIQMPGTDGFGLLRRIRSLKGEAASVPVVALSADAGREDDMYQAAGFSAYLPKPYDSTKLIGVIRELGLVAGGQVNVPESREKGGCECTDVPDLQVDNDAPPFTLDNIRRFTENDEEALRQILRSFVTATEEHLSRLESCMADGNVMEISRLAHKMLPLFRQLEAGTVTGLLQELEHPENYNMGEKDMLAVCRDAMNAVSRILKVIP